MKTRSGQTYELKCVCQKWYPNPKFNSKCSECYRKCNPEEWEKFMRDNWCPANYIDDENLNIYIHFRKTNFRGSQWKMLLKCMNDIGTMCTILNTIKNSVYPAWCGRKTVWENEFKYGITAKEGAELYARFREVHGDLYGMEQGSDWRWQHLFAGMIFDKWNITSDENGPIAYCYYGNFGAKPRGKLSDIEKSPWMSEDKRKKDFWLGSLPDDFTNFIN